MLGLSLFTRAQAHSILIRSEPADNSILQDSPQQIRLWFSEAFIPEFSSARILDLNGNPINVISQPVDPGDPTLMTLAIPVLDTGVYTVNWRVISALDGHTSAGYFVFGVRSGSLPGESTPNQPAIDLLSASGVDILLRSLSYLAAIIAIGSIGALAFVLRPGLTGHPTGNLLELTKDGARQRILTLGIAAASLSFLIGLAQITWQALGLTNTLSGQPAFFQVVGQLMTQVPWGFAWLARQASWLLVALTGWWIFRSAGINQHTLYVMLALGFCALLGLSMSSHAAAKENFVLPVVVNALHLGFVGLWVGGIIALLAGLLPILLHDRAHFAEITRGFWNPFSRLASVSVGMVIATGLYSTAQEVISADALLLNPYGKVLSTKIILFGFAGLLGLLNSMLLHPRLAAPLAILMGKPDGWTPFRLERFPGLAIAEASLSFLIILLAGILTALPPANNLAYTITPGEMPDDMSQPAHDIFIKLSARPNRPGLNLLDIGVLNSRRPAPAETLRVIVKMTYLDGEMGTSVEDAELVEAGAWQDSYRLATYSLTQPRRWAIQITVRRRGLPDSQATFDWIVQPLQDAGPKIISRSPWEKPLELTGGVIAAIVLGMIAATLLRQSH